MSELEALLKIKTHNKYLFAMNDSLVITALTLDFPFTLFSYLFEQMEKILFEFKC